MFLTSSQLSLGKCRGFFVRRPGSALLENARRLHKRKSAAAALHL
jgi:hypothetical protein